MAEEQGTKPNLLAGGRIVGDYAPYQLLAGESPLVNQKGVAGDDLLMYQVVAKAADGTIVPYTGAAPEGGGAVLSAVGVTCVAANAGSPVPYYIGGFFNHLALEWPEDLTELSDRQAVFPANGMLQIGFLPPAAPRP